MVADDYKRARGATEWTSEKSPEQVIRELRDCWDDDFVRDTSDAVDITRIKVKLDGGDDPVAWLEAIGKALRREFQGRV